MVLLRAQGLFRPPPGFSSVLQEYKEFINVAAAMPDKTGDRMFEAEAIGKFHLTFGNKHFLLLPMVAQLHKKN